MKRMWYESYDDYLRDSGEVPDLKEHNEAIRDEWRELYDDDRR